jgi:hypothetical protein
MGYERRERDVQRDAVEEVLPDEGSILRMADGQVLVYEEGPEKRRPAELRAVVMPDGERLEFETSRFRRTR